MARVTKQVRLEQAAGLVEELLNATKRSRGTKELVVGIRNVSSETIGVPAQFGEPEILLHHTPAQGDDPNATAIVSYARWQSLRKSKLYGFGMIVRDDSVLGEVDVRAPDDRPEDLHPDHAKNLVIRPHEWIEVRSEAELRDDVSAMTSESSLRRLWAAVDQKIGELEKDVPQAERRGKMSPGIKKAMMKLPMNYRLVETLVEDRLDDIGGIDREIPEKIRV